MIYQFIAYFLRWLHCLINITHNHRMETAWISINNGKKKVEYIGCECGKFWFKSKTYCKTMLEWR